VSARVKWPKLDEVEAAKLPDLLNWNHKLPAPREETENYTVLARIVERLRELQADAAGAGEALPEPDHPGWPG
jgi:hypothetical protein